MYVHVKIFNYFMAWQYADVRIEFVLLFHLFLFLAVIIIQIPVPTNQQLLRHNQLALLSVFCLCVYFVLCRNKIFILLFFFLISNNFQLFYNFQFFIFFLLHTNILVHTHRRHLCMHFFRFPLPLFIHFHALFNYTHLTFSSLGS